MSIPQPTGSGLAIWRRRKAEEKEAIVAELDKLRASSTKVEVREGREFRVVRLPDVYRWGRQ